MFFVVVFIIKEFYNQKYKKQATQAIANGSDFYVLLF